MKDYKRLMIIVFLVFLVFSAVVRVVYPSSDAPFDLSWSQGPSTDPSYYLSPVVDLLRGGAYRPISSSWNAPAYTILYLPTLWAFGVGFLQANLTTVALSLVAFAFFFLILRACGDDKTLIFGSLFWAFTYVWAMFNRIPIIYTAMVMYMLIAAWLWFKGAGRPVFFVAGWAVVLIAALFVKVIAVALVAGFLVGHLALFFGRRKREGSVLVRGSVILISAVVIVTLIVLIAKFFHLSPLDVATGRIKTHIRDDIFGNNVLLYFFNFGASGGLIERNQITAFLAYCYVLVFCKDLIQRRVDVTREKDLITIVFLAWMIIGGAATILFRYAPPRFFLFLYPPLFFLAAATLARFLDPAPRKDLGYAFYVILPLWLIFLIFHALLRALTYVAENFGTFVIGLRISVENAAKILRVMDFTSSFYLLLSVSLILSIMVSSIVFVIERRAASKKRDIIIRRGVRLAVVGAAILVFFVGQGSMYLRWIERPRYTLVEASRELGAIVGDDAKLSGTYAHPLTMEKEHTRIYMSFWAPKATPPCERFEKGKVTHLIIDTANGLGYLENNYPDAMGCLELIETFYVRGFPVDLYLYTGAESYTPSDYERAKLLMKSGDYREASETLSRFIEKHPDVAWAYVSLARCLVRQGDIEGAKEAVDKALSLDPDNMVAHWGIGQILEEKGDVEGALLHYREALSLNPSSKTVAKRLQDLQNREK